MCLNHSSPKIFTSKFQSIAHQYPKCFSKLAISSHAPLLWNNVFPVTMESLCTVPLFKKEVKENLTNFENESNIFNSI